MTGNHEGQSDKPETVLAAPPVPPTPSKFDWPHALSPGNEFGPALRCSYKKGSTRTLDRVEIDRTAAARQVLSQPAAKVSGIIRRTFFVLALVIFLTGGGMAQACDPASSICTLFQNGQTFITWPDMAIGVAGNNWRYSVYRSTSPITADNYNSATLIASYDLNNSGQLFGGDPTNATTATVGAFTQSYRQDNTRPMVKLTDLGTPLRYGTGLQVYTALASETAYYAVVANPQTGGSNTYIGASGPTMESVGTPQPIKYAASGGRGQIYGNITNPTNNIPVVFTAHASNASSGCGAQKCQYGDYWEWFLTTAGGWQDGRQTTLDVLQDHKQNYPGQANTLIVSNRDTVWNPLGTAGLETFHQGLGMTPNPLVGPANRLYLSTANGIAQMLNWTLDHYDADPNQLHWAGISMGAWAGANTGMRMVSPKFSAVWLSHPVWRMDHLGPGYWPGSSWSSAMPFKATIGAAPWTLGTVAANVRLPDGTRWAGDGGYSDTPAFIASKPGNDLPVAIWGISKNDGYAIWADEIAAKNAFESARRGFAFVWYMGAHNTTYTGLGAIDCDWSGHDDSVCYHKSDFKLDAPYIAFSNSSIDDNIGTGAKLSNGLFDGDYTGCINCGFKWTVSTDTSNDFDFTVDNTWMDRPSTVFPSTTITGSMQSCGGGTVTVASTAGFRPPNGLGNQYILIGSEVILATSVTGNSITYSGRAQLGTTCQVHNPGEKVTQLVSQPTGPNGGPYSTMTVDVTPRRVQNFRPLSGATVICTITPFGENPTTEDFSVADGIWTLTSVKINASGATSIACDSEAVLLSIPFDYQNPPGITELDPNGNIVLGSNMYPEPGTSQFSYVPASGTTANSVPEPSSMIILVTGMLGISLMGRRVRLWNA